MASTFVPPKEVPGAPKPPATKTAKGRGKGKTQEPGTPAPPAHESEAAADFVDMPLDVSLPASLDRRDGGVTVRGKDLMLDVPQDPAEPVLIDAGDVKMMVYRDSREPLWQALLGEPTQQEVFEALESVRHVLAGAMRKVEGAASLI